MTAAAVTWIALAAVGGGINLAMHGRDRKGVHNVGYWIISAGIQSGILYWGGFFG